jgi:putative methyltransferase
MIFRILIYLIDLADRLVRTIPAEDLTNGFFVSCFIRKSPSEQQGEKRSVDESGNLDTASNNTAAKKKKKNNKKKKVALTA